MSPSDAAGRLLPVVPTGGSSPVGPMNPAGPDGPVIAGGPIGPGETLSPFIHEVLEPLDHSVLDHAGPASRCLLLALWARLGRCPHLTVTLLAQLACMLQGALLAQMEH